MREPWGAGHPNSKKDFLSMCGIAGFSLNRPVTDYDKGVLRQLCDLMAYRGPDGFGEFYAEESGIGLGHRRLSILDLDVRSAQPMIRGDHVITYNGEIYNFQELKGGPLKHHNFETTSDTEVLLNLWRDRGREALSELDGMFAFAIWDGEMVSLVTDLFGEKPLYCLTRPEGIYFCSELGPLLEAFSLKLNPCPQEILDFFYLGFMRKGMTGYPDIRSIPARQLIQVKAGQIKSETTYWDFPTVNIEKGRIAPLTTRLLNDVRDILCASLHRRLRSDVPMGIFLSGGIDSSLIAALSKKELDVDVAAYTVSFSDGSDESDAASQIASALEMEHHVIDSMRQKVSLSSPGVLVHSLYGTLNDNLTALSVQQMCMAARSNITVALSGIGGDEMFFGYNKYTHFINYKYLYHYASYFLPFINIIEPFHRKAKLLKDLLYSDHNRQFLRVKNGDVTSLMEMASRTLPNSILGANNLNLVHAVRHFDLQETLPQSYIQAVERGSMRASLEVRTPFLSRELIEYVSSVDQRVWEQSGQKQVLKQLLFRYLDPSLFNRPKKGFVYPVSRFLKQRAATPPITRYFDKSAQEQLWQQVGNPSAQQVLLRLLLLENMTKEGDW